MEPFYLSHEEFWTWFNRDPGQDQQIIDKLNSMAVPSNTSFAQRSSSSGPVGVGRTNYTNQKNQFDHREDGPGFKKIKTDVNSKKPIRHIAETEASVRCDARYVIMYGKHRPGKKSKVWEGDGYLSLVNGVAHLSDLRGRMLEDPTILDDVDMGLVRDMGELLIGGTEIQIIEQEK